MDCIACVSFEGKTVQEAIRIFKENIPSAENDCDHQYILKPVTGTGKLTLNKTADMHQKSISS